MLGLPPLNSLSLPPLSQVVTIAAGGVVPGAGAVLTAAQGAVDKAKDTVLGLPIGRIIAVVVGLILIAAGVFAFSHVQDTVKTVVKAAAVVA